MAERKPEKDERESVEAVYGVHICSAVYTPRMRFRKYRLPSDTEVITLRTRMLRPFLWRLPESLYEWLGEQSAASGLSISAYLRVLVLDAKRRSERER